MARILVIDDEKSIRILLRQVLERSGYQVVEAPDGSLGMQLIRKESVDLVITDLVMPDKEGIETIVDLKKEFPEVHTIAISGGGLGSSGNYLELAKQLGAARAFSKPIDHKELLTAIEELLD